MEDRRFTDTELPVFSGEEEGWYRHIHIVQAIKKSNGWSDETAALQLFVHLKGEALDVALLLNKKVRETWTGLVQGLTAYYQSPGRLAGLRRQFAGALRQPGLDPARFATDLGMLALQGFGDMKEQARDIMIRDKFIDGQEQCALRRQLDGFAPGTPIGEIVDSCRIWESHSDPDQNVRNQIGSESENQSGDSRSRERNRVAVVVDTREQEEVLLEEMLKFIGRSILELGQEEVSPDGMEEQSEGSGNGRGFEGLGQTLGPGRGVELTQRRIPPPTVTRGLLGQCREWLEVMTNGKRIGRNSQNCNSNKQSVGTPDQRIPMSQEGGNHGISTRSELPGLWTGGCGRQSGVRPWEKGTGMFGRELFRVP